MRGLHAALDSARRGAKPPLKTVPFSVTSFSIRRFRAERIHRQCQQIHGEVARHHRLEEAEVLVPAIAHARTDRWHPFSTSQIRSARGRQHASSPSRSLRTGSRARRASCIISSATVSVGQCAIIQQSIFDGGQGARDPLQPRDHDGGSDGVSQAGLTPGLRVALEHGLGQLAARHSERERVAAVDGGDDQLQQIRGKAEKHGRRIRRRQLDVVVRRTAARASRAEALAEAPHAGGAETHVQHVRPAAAAAPGRTHWISSGCRSRSTFA